jgi:hypothetical protein
MTLDPALQMTLRAALALLWLAAASHKLRDPLRFRSALAGYAIAPERAVRALAAVVIGLELALGVSLLIPAAGSLPAFASAALLALYAGVIALNLARGRHTLDCGCGGRPQPIGEGLVARNAALFALALLAALPASGRTLVWLDAATILGGAAALAALYAAVDAALANGARSVRAPA